MSIVERRFAKRGCVVIPTLSDEEVKNTKGKRYTPDSTYIDENGNEVEVFNFYEIKK